MQIFCRELCSFCFEILFWSFSLSFQQYVVVLLSANQYKTCPLLLPHHHYHHIVSPLLRPLFQNVQKQKKLCSPISRDIFLFKSNFIHTQQMHTTFIYNIVVIIIIDIVGIIRFLTMIISLPLSPTGESQSVKDAPHQNQLLEIIIIIITRAS